MKTTLAEAPIPPLLPRLLEFIFLKLGARSIFARPLLYVASRDKFAQGGTQRRQASLFVRSVALQSHR
jgi:hypothetical protein